MNAETKLKAASIFREASSYIRTYGWRVEGMGQKGQPRCSMGALASSYSSSKWEKDLSSLMYQKLYEELDGQSLTAFNHRYRSGEAVAGLFERVACTLSSKTST
jgi:hypothetical protein